MRYQALILQSEIGLVGEITKLAFQAYISSGGSFNNVHVYLCHTSVDSLSTSFEANYGGNDPGEVFYAPTKSMSGSAESWADIVFDDPFYYNNSDNLLVEIKWSGGSGVFYTYTSNTPGYYSCGYAKSYSAPTMTYQNQWHNRFRLTIEPADEVQPDSLGKLRSLYH